MAIFEAVDINDDRAEFGAIFHWDVEDPHGKALDQFNYDSARDDAHGSRNSSLEKRFKPMFRHVNPKPSHLNSSSLMHPSVFPLPDNRITISPTEEVADDFPPSTGLSSVSFESNSSLLCAIFNPGYGIDLKKMDWCDK
ncbi:hypothetical protein B0H13DRAFT_1882022 [Mycena leptocephala]|nr:hypothetical protein B0H13DRAFT_1882022 [Mycena leptocephala]